MKKILIVEDVEFNMDLIVQLLEDKYELLGAQDGQAGINLALRERPDLVLMDMSLPVKDGWTATREMKANPELAGLHVIGLSAHAMEGDRQKALESGCDAYLTKPVDEQLLFETIDRLLVKSS